MDQALKARNMGSATARRLRMQERQVQHHVAHQERLERKKQIMSEIQSLNTSDHESDYNSSSEADLDSGAETLSDTSVQTPENGCSKSFDSLISSSHSSNQFQVKTDLQRNSSTASKPVVKPKMQATLTTVADWNYDRFSMFIEPSEVEEILEEVEETEDETIQESSDEELDEYIAIETATPVQYTTPKMKPLIITILVIHNHINRLSAQREQKSSRHVSEQSLPNSIYERTHTSDAKFYNHINSSRETLDSVNMSSLVSRSISLASQNDSVSGSSISQVSQGDLVTRSPKRKSSLPMLFAGTKSSHSRMSSIKKLMRSSTMGPPAGYHHQELQRQASNATLATHYEGRDSSVDISRESSSGDSQRPTTARNSSQPPIKDHVSAPPPTFPPPTPTGSTFSFSMTEAEEAQRKPVSRFRQRSGSIGQALKSIGTGPKKADASAPPLPMISIPPASQSVGGKFTLAPAPLRTRKSSSNVESSSARSTANKKPTDPNVGLGLSLTLQHCV